MAGFLVVGLVLLLALAVALAATLGLVRTAGLALAVGADWALVAGAETQAWLPFGANFWPLLQGAGPLANEARDSVQAAIKIQTRNFIFFKESFLPQLSWFLPTPMTAAPHFARFSALPKAAKTLVAK